MTDEINIKGDNLKIVSSDHHPKGVKIGPNWISVKDRLPKKHEWVLVHIESNFDTKKFHVGYLMTKNFMIGARPGDYDGEQETSEVTHWMPLPKPPKDL